MCLCRRCRALPLFTEELDGTLNRGADPESGHALDLHRARFRLTPAALAADGDWCYKDSRVPQGETLLNAIRLWWQWCLSPMQLCSAGRRWRRPTQDGRAPRGRHPPYEARPLLQRFKILYLQRARRRRLQLQRRGVCPQARSRLWTTLNLMMAMMFRLWWQLCLCTLHLCSAGRHRQPLELQIRGGCLR